MSKSESENRQLKKEDSEKERKFTIVKYLKIFYFCIRATLISRIFAISYPISLYFLYNKNKLFSFFITFGIILLSLIYFVCYYGKQIIYCILGYLVQFNLMFFDIYESEEDNSKINFFLCALKFLMIIEMLKRVYFYIIGTFLFLVMEIGPREDRCMYVMTFEIVYYYLWENYYTNAYSSGFHLNICFHLLGLFFSLLNGIFALGSNFRICKICMIIMNSLFLFAQLYSIYWRKRECY